MSETSHTKEIKDSPTESHIRSIYEFVSQNFLINGTSGLKLWLDMHTKPFEQAGEYSRR